jgi:cytochrome c biogenesis protein CcmG, thiol:disulfide interchange protein DsbE
VGALAVIAVAVALTVDLAPDPNPSASTIVVGRHPLLDQPAPDFDLGVLGEGSRVRLQDERSRPLLVNFWASWCIPCREEFPLFREARSHPANADLEILGVVYQDSSEAALEFMRAQQADWRALADPEGAVATAYGVLAPPMTFYVDRGGVVRAVSFGPPPRNVFEEYLERIR